MVPVTAAQRSRSGSAGLTALGCAPLVAELAEAWIGLRGALHDAGCRPGRWRRLARMAPDDVWAVRAVLGRRRSPP